MARTNNGWPKDPETVRIFVGGDTDGCEVRAGVVADLFTWFLAQMHQRVEPLTQAHGARTSAFNISVGGAPGSNHVSATAVDYNGWKHPYEIKLPPAQRYGNYKSGWTTTQIREVRQIIAETGGLLAWGLDYAAPYRDSMHFDVAKGVTVTQITRFLNSLVPPAPDPGPAPGPVPTPETDMESLLFVRCAQAPEGDGAIFLLAPGQPARHLTPQVWNLWVRCGADTVKVKGTGAEENFLRAEVDILAASLGG